MDAIYLNRPRGTTITRGKRPVVESCEHDPRRRHRDRARENGTRNNRTEDRRSGTYGKRRASRNSRRDNSRSDACRIVQYRDANLALRFTGNGGESCTLPTIVSFLADKNSLILSRRKIMTTPEFTNSIINYSASSETFVI